MENKDGILRVIAAFVLIGAVSFASLPEAEQVNPEEPIYHIQLLGALKNFCPERWGEPKNDRINCIRRGRATRAGTTVFVRVPPLNVM